MIAAAMAALLVAPASATAKPAFRRHSKEPPSVPLEFRVRGTEGYTADVFGIPARRGAKATVGVQIWNADSASTYEVPGKVGRDWFNADFGPYGVVSVHFRRRGVKRLKSRCGREPTLYLAGRFTGSFEFHTEGDYTNIPRRRLSVEPLYRFPGECVTDGGTEGGSPGVFLRVYPRYGEVTVVQNRPDAPVRVSTSIEFRSHGVEVAKLVEVFAPPSSFSWSSNLERASLSPPLPFSGSARYEYLGGTKSHWTGNLKVDFPGIPRFRLTRGPSLTDFFHGRCWVRGPQIAGPPMGSCQ
jgi:hypothetical protein